MCLRNNLSYIWNNSQHSLSFSSIQQLYKDIILQYWNPSARALCYRLNAGPQSQCFSSVGHEWTTCSHRESVPSIPAHWTGRILKDSRTIQRYNTTHSCTITHTHTRTHGQIHARVVGASRHPTVRAGHSRETESGLKDGREGGQLFSNRDSRSSLLLLGRSGGPR